ncbi:MAG: pirin family protein [Proteobacteria bacterium]|jgi:redox-sensitive bicupin YhaK (pirin superfamily)|nr:pirin family protein [Pseudomonadota bacterium]
MSDSKIIDLIIEPDEKDLGEFTVRRSLPAAGQRMIGPWLFFDHMGPATFAPGQGVAVRPHPHINLSTVTYLFEGEILHRDSLGSVGTIRPGDINLMVAGKGIVHSERERPEVNEVEHRLHGLQLWLALPEEDEETEPAFYHYPGEDLPVVKVGSDIDGVTVRVMMGSAYGVTSPVKIHADTLYVEADLKQGQSLALPSADERGLYLVSGKVEARDNSGDASEPVLIDKHKFAVLSPNADVQLTALEDSRLALIGGENIGPRHLFWNFASSSKQRIEQAGQDWKDGKFPKIPGDEEEFIPLPD